MPALWHSDLVEMRGARTHPFCLLTCADLKRLSDIPHFPWEAAILTAIAKNPPARRKLPIASLMWVPSSTVGPRKREIPSE